MKIAILVFDRFTDLDVFLPWDLLSRVSRFHLLPNWEVKLVGTASHHTSENGLTIPMSASLSFLKTADAVLFASGPGVQTLLTDPSVLTQLHSLLDPKRQLIGSICSGSLLLAKLGLLDGLTATTYPTRMKQLAAMGVEVLDAPLVIHDRIATAAGCLAAIDLTRWLIQTLASQEIATKVLASVRPNGI
ncbi:thiamine biosynthesis protein ThiJ [Tumebacillus algifaecis]|uniref:Thiamine biosynthesis protein ThiJ n=1 Tax=Tumebacillus algifaecis TaxID=1214604 RepID=A0A223D3B0_9BACL|nr:DJ-1/PfpI family protein [Tumebacillus algifaecis]ASS76060.1 thiamine biosynthesis protein ThiJ [Tumebacillus algifaecis]